jgi:hypothetical protein
MKFFARFLCFSKNGEKCEMVEGSERLLLLLPLPSEIEIFVLFFYHFLRSLVVNLALEQFINNDRVVGRRMGEAPSFSRCCCCCLCLFEASK